MTAKIIGHRGYSAKYPENTLLSIRSALQIPACQGIEIDLHLTKDNYVILQHDEDLDRMTDGEGKICEKNYKGYIDALNTVGTISEPVALFTNVMEYLNSSSSEEIILVLDVKDDQSLLVLDHLKEILVEFPSDKIKIYLGVWRDDFALYARKLFSSNPSTCPLITLIADSCDLERVRSPLYDAFNLNVDEISEDVVKEAAKLGKDVLLWTCNTADQIIKAKSLNVQGILTDDPHLI